MCVASLDTAAATELCVRTALAYAGRPFRLVVGDSGSTDGTLSRLRRFEQRGWLTLEVAPDGRRHAEWLNHWVANCASRYLVFVDSDMEFLRRGWLTDIVECARATGAAMVTSRLQDLGDLGHRTKDGSPLRWAKRPTPWLMLVDTEQLRGLDDAGFGYRQVDDPERLGGRIAYDTGAYTYAALEARGLTCVAMPDGWDACYHHFGGMTWIRRRRAAPARRVRQALKRRHIWLRLQRARLVCRDPMRAAVATPSDR